MLGIHQSLDPVLIEEYDETFELIVAEIKVANREVRTITGFGPQEGWKDCDKMPFFVALEEEISKAQLAGKSIIIELDANSKLGDKYVVGDPHKISPNGQLLKGIIERHALHVANGVTTKSSGVITRCRSTVKSTEESVIDYVIIGDDMLTLLVSIHVDDERKSVLTNITTKNGRTVRKESDHNSIITKFGMQWNSDSINERIEIFNFKDPQGMAKFKAMTSNNTILSSIFDTNKSVNILSKN